MDPEVLHIEVAGESCKYWQYLYALCNLMMLDT